MNSLSVLNGIVTLEEVLGDLQTEGVKYLFQKHFL